MTIEFKNMSDASNHVTIRRKLIEKYAGKKPRMFLQIDHFGGDEWFCPITWELMEGSPLRILFSGEIKDPLRLAEMLRAVADNFGDPENQERLSTQLAGLGDPENSRHEVKLLSDEAFDELPF